MLKKPLRLLSPDNGSNPAVPGGAIPTGADPTPEIGKTTGTGEIPATTPQLAAEDAHKEIERLKADLKKVHAESATHRLAANELKKLQDQIASEKLSESEKLQKQIAEHQLRESEATRQLQDERNYNALERAGRRAGITDETALSDMVSIALGSAELENDESTGKPTNADEVMKALVKARPWLIGKAQTQTSGGATNPSRSSSNAPQELTIKYVGEIMAGGQKAMDALPPEERQRVRAWIQAGGMLHRR